MSKIGYTTSSQWDPLKLINLHSLMDLSSGSPDVVVGVIDGPVDLNHPAFQCSQIRTAKVSQIGVCKSASSIACMHGTFVMGILSAKRGVAAPAICPSCKIVLRPIFIENASDDSMVLPSSTPEELSNAIIETVDAGARIINLSLGLSSSSVTIYDELKEAYNYALQNDVIVVVASGNQGSIGYVSLLNNQWIIPVAACDELGRFSPVSNFGPSIGNRGLMAPGINVTSTAPKGKYTQMDGTSIATPFVTGAIALLWSEFPKATASEIKHSVIASSSAPHRRRTIIPQILNAETAREYLRTRLSQAEKG